tara:strand:- start:2886 stop:3005 length:120 start_codon:yes stop_codon:yes gene_type:complete
MLNFNKNVPRNKKEQEKQLLEPYESKVFWAMLFFLCLLS